MAGSCIPLLNLDSNNAAPLNDPNHTEAARFRFKQPNLIRFCKTFVRCLATIVLIAFLLATLKIYQNKGNFTSHQKTNFNIIITALSLCLGLNFFVSHKLHDQEDIQGLPNTQIFQDSFKDLAKVLRWKILERCRHNVETGRVQRDLILAIESLIHVAWLGWKSRSIPWLCIFCFSWVSRPF